MAESKTGICNLALSHLGVGSDIANIESERSPEATACRRFYDLALSTTLREFPWGFATKLQALALVEQRPNDEWAYSYGYPTDCLFAVRILSGLRNDTPDSRVLFTVARESGGGSIILTDKPEAVLQYTSLVENPMSFPADFTSAFSLKLAFYIAPRVTGGDPYKLGDRALKLYQLELARAKGASALEKNITENIESEFIRARE